MIEAVEGDGLLGIQWHPSDCSTTTIATSPRSAGWWRREHADRTVARPSSPPPLGRRGRGHRRRSRPRPRHRRPPGRDGLDVVVNYRASDDAAKETRRAVEDAAAGPSLVGGDVTEPVDPDALIGGGRRARRAGGLGQQRRASRCWRPSSTPSADRHGADARGQRTWARSTACRPRRGTHGRRPARPGASSTSRRSCGRPGLPLPRAPTRRASSRSSGSPRPPRSSSAQHGHQRQRGRPRHGRDRHGARRAAQRGRSTGLTARRRARRLPRGHPARPVLRARRRRRAGRVARAARRAAYVTGPDHLHNGGSVLPLSPPSSTNELSAPNRGSLSTSLPFCDACHRRQSPSGGDQ